MKEKAPSIPRDKLELYDLLIASHPDIQRKGKTMPYTSCNGHMFSYLSKEGVMGLRLPETERKIFMEKYDATLFEQFGKVMKEFVTIPDSLLEDTADLGVYLNMSYEHIQSLKPKATRKKG